MRLLHGSDATPFGRKVRIVLTEKGLEYDRDTTLTLERPDEEFARLNPALRVPVLVDGERTLFDSDLIVAYLLETYPGLPPGAPQPPLADTPSRAEQRWEDGMLLSCLNALLETVVNLRQLGLNGVTPEQSPYLHRHERRIQTSLAWLEARATPEGFVAGRFSVQDIALICALDFGERFDIFPWREYPTLETILRYFGERPSVAATRLPG